MEYYIIMRKIKNTEWENYRHPEFLQSLNISVNELKYIRLFLKRGAICLINEILRERKSKQINHRKENNFVKVNKNLKISI